MGVRWKATVDEERRIGKEKASQGGSQGEDRVGPGAGQHGNGTTSEPAEHLDHKHNEKRCD